MRWFSVPAAGLDHPVFTMVLQRGVRLTNAHVTDIPISEYVLRAVLDHYQQAGLWRDAQGRSAWDRHQFREVAGSRWLIVGLGAIGQAIATRARAFGAHVTGCRRNPTGDEPVDAYVSPADLLAALPDADVVVLSLPGENDVPPLVDATFLAAMAEGSMLINIARGSLVDEGALVEALDRGRPEFAVLDVTVTEPLPSDSPTVVSLADCAHAAQLSGWVEPVRALRRPARRQPRPLRPRRAAAQRDLPHLRNLLVVLSASTLPPV